MATKQLILTENIPGLGSEADVVTVRAGYARNFLLPRSMAYEVNPTTMRRINLLKAKRAQREAAELTEAEDLARRIKKLTLNFTLETGGSGKAFGSVTAQDIADRLKTELGGQVIDRHKLVLEKPIKENGEFAIPIKIHADVPVELKIVVKTTEPEPVAQPSDEGQGETRRPPRKRK